MEGDVGGVEGDERSDEALVAEVRAGDERALHALLARYRPRVRMMTSHLFIIGADRDDVVQEGLIGLSRAIGAFDPAKGSFADVAERCITRQVYTAIRAARRHKHAPLSTADALDPVGAYDVGPHAAPESEPERAVLARLELDDVRRRCGAVLTAVEHEVLARHVDGASYAAIAAALGVTSKVVDNALQRGKRKLAALAADGALAAA